MKTDPSETGGLFVGRRPGTRPVRYRAIPEVDDARRGRDRALAAAILALMTLIGVSFWGPVPAAGLWVGGQVQGEVDNVGAAIAVSFALIMLLLFSGLAVMKRLDQAWILVRRAAGYDQREGVIGRIFAISCAIGVVLFTLWFLLVAGPGPSLAPTGG